MSEIFPVFGVNALPVELELVAALVFGFFFGFVLERAGFGNAKILAAQFYMHNMRVFKVMFTSIITAGAGLAIASSVGMVNMSAIFTPETFFIPHLVGG